MFEITIGSLNTVPLSTLRIVPFGDFHIFLRPNSATRASSGVIVAHLMPTPCSKIARAASSVTWSSVASLLAFAAVVSCVACVCHVFRRTPAVVLLP